MPEPTKKRSKKESSRILPPPKSFSSWLAYAVTTMDTRHLALDHQWGNQPQWPDDISREEFRIAAHSELSRFNEPLSLAACRNELADEF
jgi:hypothetical protein